jgi:hypothetical protein
LDLDQTFPDPDPCPSFQIRAQTLEKVLKSAHIPYILACLLQIDADPDPDFYLMQPGSGFFDADEDPDANPGSNQNDVNPCGSGSPTLFLP